MQEVHLIEDTEKAGELLKPIRVEILSLLSEPRSCPEIAKRLGLSTQKVNYHVRILQEAGMVNLIDERRNRGTIEGIYQAAARSFWFSPRLVKRLGGDSVSRDKTSLTYLLRLGEELQIEIGRLAEESNEKSVPSLGLDARIQLKTQEDRRAFMQDLQEMFKDLARKYGASESGMSQAINSFRLIIACYPNNYDSGNKFDQ